MASLAKPQTWRRVYKGIAEPDTVVIAEGTRRLLGNLFEFEDLGAKGPKGHLRDGAGLRGVAGKFGGRPL